MEESLTLKQVANILQVEPSTVRFWEKEFIDFLEQPEYKGQRKRFSPKNLEILLQIKDLLQAEQYTIKGAVRRLEMERSMTAALGIDSNYKTTLFFMFNAILDEIHSCRRELKELRDMVAKQGSADKGEKDQSKDNILDFFRDKFNKK